MANNPLIGKCKNWAVSLALLLSPNLGCGIKEGKDGFKSDVCSYDPIEETLEERISRLGDIKCEEVIPGHNNSFGDRINILFIGVNYNLEQFLETAKNATDCTRENYGILSHDIFSGNLEQFNFWHYPDVQSLPFYEGRYHDENGTLSGGLSGLGSRLAQNCNGENTRLHNFAPIVLAAEGFRPHSSYSPLINYNLDGANYSSLINLRERLIEENIDSGMCQGFVNTCDLLDANLDGKFTDEDLNLPKRYSDIDLQNMCLAIHTPAQCQQMDWNEITQDYRSAEHNYGFQLCQTLSEVSIESTINPSDELCEVMLGTLPYLGTAVVFSKKPVPQFVGHEIGHSIATLRDEYVESSKDNLSANLQRLTANGINCFVGTYDECMEKSNWSHLENTGCYEGCNYIEHGAYRPTENSIMRSSSHGEGYGPYNEERFCRVIKLLTGNANGICAQYLNR